VIVEYVGAPLMPEASVNSSFNYPKVLVDRDEMIGLQTERARRRGALCRDWRWQFKSVSNRFPAGGPYAFMMKEIPFPPAIRLLRHNGGYFGR